MLINLILVLFCSLMIWGAISDIRYFILSNKLCISVISLYPIFILALFINGSPPSLSYVGWSIGIASIIFTLLIGLFAFGFIGGGDVKLIPAVALWAGPAFILKFLLITVLCGGVISLLIISFQYVKKYTTKDKSSENINLSVSKSEKSKNERNKIPYGIGISAGGLFIAYELFQVLN